MFKADEEKSRRTRGRIRAAFSGRVREPGPYTIVYAYLLKKGIFGRKSESFVVGFSEELKELVVVPVNYAMDEAADAIRLNRANTLSAKFGFQGEVKIRSFILEGELRFIVPPYTPPALENFSILPVNQETEAKEFRNFIEQLQNEIAQAAARADARREGAGAIHLRR
ncbi:MAG: hypothetical protein LBQ63_04065 [Deltaproteobacteria bacterium]|jgi:hypothetical protein|nr:hypothetical protein [Deltaproteobacteria bacterium]